MKFKVIKNDSTVYILISALMIYLILTDALTIEPISIWVLLLIVLVFSMNLFANIYERNVFKHLTITPLYDEIRLYKGEAGTLKYLIRQNGRMPIFQARLILTAVDFINFDDEVEFVPKLLTETEIKFSLLGKSESIIEVPFTARHRGTSHITDLQILIPKLFSFGELHIAQVGQFSNEILIYPDRLASHNESIQLGIKAGSFPVTQSLYHDPLLTSSNRNYQEGDNYRDIHWKLSAKRGELITKLYEKTTHLSIMVLINLRSHQSYRAPNNIEEIFEKVAFLTGEFTKNNYPYQIVTNMKKHDGKEFLHLNEGRGKLHYRHTLEMIARLKIVSPTVALDQFFIYLRQEYALPTHLIVTGELDTNDMSQLVYYAKKGIKIYQINQEGLRTLNFRTQARQEGVV